MVRKRTHGLLLINIEAKTVEEKCDMLMNKDGEIVKELIGIKHLIRSSN